MARGKLFDAALFAAAGLADGDTALRLLHRMWGERLPAGYLAHGHVIRALCNARRFKVADCLTINSYTHHTPSLPQTGHLWPHAARA